MRQEQKSATDSALNTEMPHGFMGLLLSVLLMGSAHRLGRCVRPPEGTSKPGPSSQHGIPP